MIVLKLQLECRSCFCMSQLILSLDLDTFPSPSNFSVACVQCSRSIVFSEIPKARGESLGKSDSWFVDGAYNLYCRITRESD